MKLFPDALLSQIPPLRSQDTVADPQAYARVLSPIGMVWFVLGIDKIDEDLLFVYVIDEKAGQYAFESISYIEDHVAIIAVDNLKEVTDVEEAIERGEAVAALRLDEKFTPRLLSQAIAEENMLRKQFGLPEAISQPNRPYYFAATFPNESLSKQAGDAIKEIIKHAEQLSYYRFLLEKVWHVVVIGDWPTQDAHQQIVTWLNTGTMTYIPFELLMGLFNRRLEEIQKGDWREHHVKAVLKRKPKNTKKVKRNPRHRGKH